MHTPRLDDASVYFKSGSYYSGGSGKYAGTKFNYMNSVISEHPDGNELYCLSYVQYFRKELRWGSHVSG
jgi:hypothetical protein